MANLVVIVGPIASGKTTVADSLGAAIREAGREVAVLDLDDAVEACGGWNGLTPDRFRKAQIVYTRHVSAWLEQGVDVIAHGPLFEPPAMDTLLDCAPSQTEVFHVRLLATYESALDRVSRGSARGLSRDPGFLKTAYMRAEPLLDALPRPDWVFDTTCSPSAGIVRELLLRLLNPAAADHPQDASKAARKNVQACLLGPVIGCDDAWRLAEFYASLLGWRVVDRSERVPGGWALVKSATGDHKLEFQREDPFVPPIWPTVAGQQQMGMHLDIGIDGLGSTAE